MTFENTGVTGEDLATLSALLAKATPGPWRVGRQDGAPRHHLVDMGEPPKAPYFRMHKGIPASGATRGSPAFGIVESDDASAEEIAANAALIVAVVNALPRILAALSHLPSGREGKADVKVGPDAANSYNRRLHVNGSQWAKVYGWDEESAQARADIIAAVLVSASPASLGGKELGSEFGQSGSGSADRPGTAPNDVDWDEISRKHAAARTPASDAEGAS